MNDTKTIEELKSAGTEMAGVLDDLIRQFHRNPMQPNIANTVVQADRTLHQWKCAQKKQEGERADAS